MKHIKGLKWGLCAAMTVLAVGSVHAQVAAVSDAWVRATVAGQKATGAFMKITSKDGAKLVSASSSAAGVTEIHEMKMDKDVMKMAAVAALPIAAGKTVELKPGGYHVMLMDLKGPLAEKSQVPITLTFEDSKGAKSKVELTVPVKSVTTMADHKH